MIKGACVVKDLEEFAKDAEEFMGLTGVEAYIYPDEGLCLWCAGRTYHTEDFYSGMKDYYGKNLINFTVSRSSVWLLFSF